MSTKILIIPAFTALLALSGCGNEGDTRYLFYLHGAVVSRFGNMAVNPSAPEWGSYHYSAILDSLQKAGFVVISEIRKNTVDDSVYINKIVHQVDSLLKKGTPPHHIVLTGASAGGDLVLRASSKIKNKHVRIALLGACGSHSVQAYQELQLYGDILSIIEDSDPRPGCTQAFRNHKTISRFRELTVHTGLSHGFIYNGYREWIDPIVNW